MSLNSNESELLKIYKEQFDYVTSRIRRLIDNYKLSSSDENENLLHDVERNFKEGERILKQIELELNLQGIVDSKAFRASYAEKKRVLDDLRSFFRREKENLKFKEKERLLIKVSFENPSTGKKDPLLVNNESIDSEESEKLTILSIESKSNEKLNTIIRTGIEMQYISEGIKKDLHRQTDDIININKKVQLVNNTIDSSNSTVHRMLSNGRRNKILVGIFSLTLVCMFILIVISRNY
jgi:hypothetical protein